MSSLYANVMNAVCAAAVESAAADDADGVAVGVDAAAVINICVNLFSNFICIFYLFYMLICKS